MSQAPSIEQLMREIARYLTVVEAFRAAGCQPIWRPEGRLEPGTVVRTRFTAA